MNRGTEQRERFPAGLEAGAFGVDEISIEQRLAMSWRLAEQLYFLDLAENQAGTWDELFWSDESLVLARIIATDRDALRARFLRDFDTVSLYDLARHVFDLAGEIDLWFKCLVRNDAPAAVALRLAIKNLVREQLDGELATTEWAGAVRDSDADPIAQVRAQLDSIWSKSAPTPAPRVATGQAQREQLRLRFFAFLGAIGRLQLLARQLLPESLQSGAHAPAAGLLIAFARLFEKVQQHINRFTDRHIDFYYRACLGFTEQRAQPDHAHLVCERDPNFAGEVPIPAGTAFSAGKDAAGNPIEFRVDSDLPLLSVTDARVEALKMLRLERDPLVSPEHEFDYVTRVKATEITPGSDAAQGAGFPLFGGVRGSAGLCEDARIGLAVASPLLLLKEGERQVRITLWFAAPAEQDRIETLLDRALRAKSGAEYSDAVGRLFRQWLLAPEDALENDDIDRLRRSPNRGAIDEPSHEADPLNLIAGSRECNRSQIFNSLFGNLFAVSLTTPAGWWRAANAFASRKCGGAGQRGLEIVMRMRAEDPPVSGYVEAVHRTCLSTDLPVAQLQPQSTARVCPYSLLDELMLDQVEISVEVRGVRDVAVHNNFGRLDSSKPFQPFGPLPTLSSYLVFGAPELARKNLDRLRLRLAWGDLPQDDDGFAAHYRAYGPGFDTASFTTTISLLCDGQWQPAGNAKLFALDADDLTLQPVTVIEVDGNAVRKFCNAGVAATPFDQGARNGYGRLRLAGPRGAFGHDQYPMLLAERVAANARRRRPEPLPNPPYTPLLEHLTLDYDASSTIAFGNANVVDVGTGAECLFHLHPFGVEPLDTAAGAARPSLLPHTADDGNLYIGVRAARAPSRLALLFDLRDEAAAPPRANEDARTIRWAALQGDAWLPLGPARVLADTTARFLTSGVVTLDLPEGIDDVHRVLPAGLYWLRVSTSVRAPDAFAAVRGVHAQALRLTRVLATDAREAPAALAAGSIAQAVAAIPGLTSVRQIGPSFGSRAPEDSRALRTRAGERLRHRQRASTAWDFERLVLERFPGVFRVKCLSPQESGLPVGNVLVAVLPELRLSDSGGGGHGPRLSAVVLRQIKEALESLAPLSAQITVRNAAYERIQVRCTVGLARGATTGMSLRRINDAISEYLSPWHEVGYPARFGWTVRGQDIEAHLRKLDCVDYVARTSLLRIARDDGDLYTLDDTATIGDGTPQIVCKWPWSIALPMPNHIVAAVERLGDRTPEPTGIAQLCVGSTFIVGGGGR